MTWRGPDSLVERQASIAGKVQRLLTERAYTYLQLVSKIDETFGVLPGTNHEMVETALKVHGRRRTPNSPYYVLKSADKNE